MEQYERAVVTQILLSLARSMRTDDLSVAEIATLYVLDIKGPMRVGELADALAMQLPGASKVAADLVTRELCERRDDPADRRAKVISIAGKGREMIEIMTQRRIAELPLVMNSLDPNTTDKVFRMLGIIVELGMFKAAR